MAKRNMKNKISLLIYFLFCLGLIHGQSIQNKEKFIKFSCYNKLDSILLPSDFYGPKYYCYEEGSIISFTSHDTCFISILCGGNAILTIDSTYERIDTVKGPMNERHRKFYSCEKNRFARQDYMNNYFIMYENASKFRKEDLDIIFDSLMKK